VPGEDSTDDVSPARLDLSFFDLRRFLLLASRGLFLSPDDVFASLFFFFVVVSTTDVVGTVAAALVVSSALDGSTVFAASVVTTADFSSSTAGAVGCVLKSAATVSASVDRGLG
jgi:hypothetical protein